MERLAAHQRAKQPIAPARLGRADSARNVSVPNEGTFTHSSDKRKGRVAQRSLTDKTDRRTLVPGTLDTVPISNGPIPHP